MDANILTYGSFWRYSVEVRMRLWAANNRERREGRGDAAVLA